MTRLGGHEPAVETRQGFVGEPVREDLEALAGAGLDQRGDHQAVEQDGRLVVIPTCGLLELLHVLVRLRLAHRGSSRFEALMDLAEVRGLFASQRAEGLDDFGSIRPEAAHQRQCALCGFELAVGVVDHHRVQVVDDSVDPAWVGRSEKVEHPACSRESQPVRRGAPKHPTAPKGRQKLDRSPRGVKLGASLLP